MKIDRFEDMIAWQKSKLLTIELYSALKSCKDFNFKDHLLRASISIMNNIAEGFERQTNNEFRQFLYISKGSSAEVRSMLYLSVELGYLPSNKCHELLNLSLEISKILSGLIKSLK